MRARKSWLVALLFVAAAGCDRGPLEEYPTSDEVPVTEPAAEAPGGNTVGLDTVLDPIIPPPPGTTPP